ncbi:hypothetical protein GOP47_0009807 [Adiantum capillus-veneris]|uniref:Methyltransferase FkbM domain-containing protein n=1 Tax=Adiantum capillus-veneris TaxID=13818 RepID=A0A9D4ZJU3_ADICA|nr:hypothetical protein GOP47_0009807 [Adiantum capillus-veneris]
MGSAKFPSWRRERSLSARSGLRRSIACFIVIGLVIIVLYRFGPFPMSYALCYLQPGMFSNMTLPREAVQQLRERPLTSLEFDCNTALQTGPVVAHKVEKVNHPFFISIAELGTFEKPNRNFQRILKGKLFQKPAISETVQTVLQRLKARGLDTRDSVIVDVGANVGMATFAAAAMGFRVLAFEPIADNIQKLCDGVYLNRASSLVQLYHLAVSNIPGYITMHKVVGRLDNSAVSATSATLAFKDNEIIPVTIKSVTLDSILPPLSRVLLLKIDVQGWEYHVLKGASDLLSRPPNLAPYIIYEEDEKLLKESNSTSEEILQYLKEHGYHHCIKDGGDRHCVKEKHGDLLKEGN